MLRMDSNISNDGRFEQHIIDATAQARQAAIESKKYAGIAVKAAEAASGGSLSGVARVDACNVFTKTNTFGACTVFNGAASFARYAYFCRQDSKNGGDRLYNYNGVLYWGCTELHGGGDLGSGYARLDGSNVFTGENTFDYDVSLYGGKFFTGGVWLYDGGSALQNDTYLMNHGGDLYWGRTRLNCQGGGDVYTNRSNVFTSGNTFDGWSTVFNHGGNLRVNGHMVINDDGTDLHSGSNRLQNHNGDLYWGATRLNGVGAKLDGCNEFTESNVFNGNVSFGGNVSLFDRGHCVNYGLYNNNGDLYWGSTRLNGGGVKLDSCNVFTGRNVFTSHNNRMRGLDIGTEAAPAKRLRIEGNSISVISGENTVVGSATLEKFAAFLNTL